VIDCLPWRCWLHSCHLLWEMRSANLLESKNVAPRSQDRPTCHGVVCVM